MDAVQEANAGHPGTAMALAPIAYLLYAEVMRHSPSNPHWPDRDRFTLSAGNACILQYSALHLTGYNLSLQELKRFRQWQSATPGHPEFRHTEGVEVTTGPLGQGFANGVGMAFAERFLAGTFNRPHHEIVDHRLYAICSDGDLMEGVSYESGSLAGTNKLGKLIYFSHGSPLGADEVAAAKRELGWDPDKHFYVPDEVYAHMNGVERGAALETEWEQRFSTWSQAFPDAREEWDAAWSGRIGPWTLPEF